MLSLIVLMLLGLGVSLTLPLMFTIPLVLSLTHTVSFAHLRSQLRTTLRVQTWFLARLTAAFSLVCKRSERQDKLDSKRRPILHLHNFRHAPDQMTFDMVDGLYFCWRILEYTRKENPSSIFLHDSLFPFSFSAFAFSASLSFPFRFFSLFSLA